MTETLTVGIIPGDGIGRDVTRAARIVLNLINERCADISFVYKDMDVGEAAIKKHGSAFPDETREGISNCDVILFGAIGAPHDFVVLSGIRYGFNLFANVRPIKSFPGVKVLHPDADLVVIRENTEGLYSGVENQVTPDVVMSMKVATETACDRIARWGFRFATLRKRKKITVFHKANIMKITDGLFLRCARKVHQTEYPNIEYEEVIIDAGCMKLVQDPSQFDVLLLENLYGDVVSDLCAGLVGGLGVVPGANFGEELAVFEAVHGSAPDIAGQGVANPLAVTMSTVMMLNHLAGTRDDPSCRESADQLKAAYNRTLSDGCLTRDLGGDLNTQGFVDALIERIEAPPS
ncbi:MAG TPA: NAD-dependent isocitrate dehydrogenase [Planctomycetaceae bacterium]|nr:NAD-dependent isocitrate dehydrogenase [Planctomycetaceae bacterium]